MIRDIMMANEAVTPNQREMEILQEYFPTCFHSDGSFDLTRFSEFLKDKVNVTKEGYELKFLGKNYARMLASLDTETVIVPDDTHNSKPENINSENVYISGDNLDGLKHLLKSYSGKIKCIYIDPPYNTGTDGFVYNDKFNFTIDDLMEKLSISEEQAKHILDLTTRGSASHSAWLMFMYPRLQLARDLLSNDGAIFISIDDNEQANLKVICDDIFGEENCMGTIARATGQTTGQDSGGLGSSFDYAFVYGKHPELDIAGIPLDSHDLKRFENEDERGWYAYEQLRKTGSNDRREDRPNMYYPIKNPDGEDLYTVAENLRDFKGMNLLVDIGNGTMNVMYLNNGRPIESKSWTEKLGVNQCFIRIQNHIMNQTGVKLPDEIISQFLQYGEIDVNNKYLNMVKEIAEQYVKEIFEKLRDYEYNEDLMKLYVMGGGAKMVEMFGKYNQDRVTFNHDICANAKGYEYFCYMMLRQKMRK